MTIAIHISGENREVQLFKLKNRLFKLLAEKHPDDHFIFIMDDPKTKIGALPPNCTPSCVGPRVRNKLMRRYWYDLKLPSIIQRYNADVFIPSGIYLSQRIRCKQVLIVDEKALKKSFKTLETKNVLSAASFIISTSCDAREMLIKKFDVSIKKLECIYPGQDAGYGIITQEEKENIRREFTSGNHYFLAKITPVNEECFVPLMKAFSIFKKFQKSGMVIMLVSEGSVSGRINQLLSNYKFRKDVIHIPESERFPEITAAAFAAFLISNENNQEGINAIACGIPIISKAGGKIYDNAVLYADCTESELAEKMMTLYKDEHLYYELVEKGQQLMEKYSWEKAIADTWTALSR